MQIWRFLIGLLGACYMTLTAATNVQIGPFVPTPSGMSVAKTIDVPTSLDNAWAMWTTTEGLRSFFSPDSRIELRPGGDFEMLFLMSMPVGKRGSEGSKVLAYVPRQFLAFSWNAPPAFGALRDQHTWVVIRFEALDANRTRLHFTHYGFGDGEAWKKVHDYFEAAWGSVLAKFAKQAERRTASNASQVVPAAK
jgi:uncharacterized protein YndB with AHSA1/START domain